jgi:hypothetical protein
MQNIVGPIAKMLSKRTKFAFIEKNARGDTKQRDFFCYFYRCCGRKKSNIPNYVHGFKNILINANRLYNMMNTNQR